MTTLMSGDRQVGQVCEVGGVFKVGSVLDPDEVFFKIHDVPLVLEAPLFPDGPSSPWATNRAKSSAKVLGQERANTH